METQLEEVFDDNCRYCLSVVTDSQLISPLRGSLYKYGSKFHQISLTTERSLVQLASKDLV